MESIGRIYGEPTEDKISFVSLDYYPMKYIQLQDDDCKYLSIYKIIESKAKNKHFSSPENIKYFHQSENVSRDVIYLYEARLISAIENNKIIDYVSPPYPGRHVYPADSTNVATAYGMNPSGLPVGHLIKSLETKVLLKLEDVFNPHMLIVGRTGSGKSFFAKGLIRMMEKMGWTVLIFSPTNEYNGVCSSLRVINSSDIVMPYNDYNMESLLNLTPTECLHLKKFYPNFQESFSLQQYADYIVNSFLNSPSRSNRNRGAYQNSLFPKESIENQLPEIELPAGISSLVNKIAKRRLNFSTKSEFTTKLDRSTVIDMSVSTQSEQEIILHFYTNSLLNIKKKSPANRGKHVVIIEEAHNYVPSVRSTACKETIIRLAREGRKHEISLCFITQRPRNFDQTAFSQSSNKFIFSLPHPDDIRHVLDDVTYYSSDLISVIQRQRQGECTINGDAFRDAVSIKVVF